MLKFCTRSVLTNVCKRVCGIFFLFCLELELFPKIKNCLVSTHSQKPDLSITQDLNKILKNPTHPFVDISKTETCGKFQQKILNSTLVGARQSFEFFRQITWFLWNTRALSKFKYWILYHLISVIKWPNNLSVNPNFMLTTRPTLNHYTTKKLMELFVS